MRYGGLIGLLISVGIISVLMSMLAPIYMEHYKNAVEAKKQVEEYNERYYELEAQLNEMNMTIDDLPDKVNEHYQQYEELENDLQ